MVYTARVTYQGPDALNITAMDQDPVGRHFAPSWYILKPLLRKRKEAGDLSEQDWAAYEASYTAEMRDSYQRHRAVWDGVLARESVTLLCFCTHVKHCHRYVCAGILEKLGAKRGGER